MKPLPILTIAVAVLTLGATVKVLHSQYERSQARTQARAAQDAESQRQIQRADAILARLDAPAAPDPDAARKLHLAELVRLRGALASCASTDDLAEIQTALKYYQEETAKAAAPSAWIPLLPGARVTGLQSEIALLLERHTERALTPADYTAAAAAAQRLAAQIDAALPLLK